MQTFTTTTVYADDLILDEINYLNFPGSIFYQLNDVRYNFAKLLKSTVVQQKKFLTPSQALERIKKYCAYQERSHQEVRYKLLELGQRGNDLENIMTKLIEEGFLNEQRFALAFAGGKFRMKEWGRNKIEQELNRRGISGYCINKALKEIDERDYRKTLQKALKKKLSSLHDANIFSKKQKLSRYLIGRGFEPDLVWEAVNEVFRR